MGVLKPYRKIIALSRHLGAGFPLTRRIEGTWAGRASDTDP
jgi:hypothetical protein